MEKYRCVQALHRQGATVEQVCLALEISCSGYYDWQHHKPGRRERSNQALRRKLVSCTRNILPWGWIACTTCSSRNSAVPASGSIVRCGLRGSPRRDAGPIKPPPTPGTIIYLHPIYSNETSVLNAQTRPGWAISPTSQPGKAGSIWPLSRTYVPEKSWAMPFLSASTLP